MMKKLLILGMIFWGLSLTDNVWAQDGGQVILDLKGDEEPVDDGFAGVLGLGWSYVQDVKTYNELLDGKNIEKDFTQDIVSKYKFPEEKAKKWQKYVRKGVKGYRFFQDLKEKIVSKILNPEKPLVVADDQYEMGEDEEYIESDKPVIIHKFKKVVAYSDSPKDQLAAREKYAKEHDLPRPSMLMEKYKKALLEKDWATLFNFDWREFFGSIRSRPEGKSDVKNPELKAVVLLKLNGTDKQGEVEGVVMIQPEAKSIVLLSDYDEYDGLKVDFGASENLDKANIHFVLPQVLELKQQNVLAYVSKFPIYFSAKAKDASKSLILRPKLEANVCKEDKCEKIEVQPEISASPKEELEETSFATYINTVSQNIPHERNRSKYKFGSLVWEGANQEHNGRLRLDVKTDRASHFKIFIVSEEAKYFAKPKVGINNDKITVRFDVKNSEFVPIGKKITFWVRTDPTSQYLYQAKVGEVSALDIDSGEFSLGIMLLAFIGGLLLNLMPCVFPVLSLKLLNFSKFGGLNLEQIRRNFAYNSLGIMVSFLGIAIILSGLKLAGYALGWGMQFQNIYFLVAIIWVVTLFLAHVLGVVNLQSPQFFGRMLNKTKSNNSLFEFLSGVFLVVLSTPCMAPYLGTAFGIALAGSIKEILLTVGCVGLGLATPYLLIAACPSIAFFMPKPGKWLGAVNLITVLLLIITLAWLISVLAAQSADAEMWHWALYIIIALVALSFRKTVCNEIDKLEDKNIKNILYRRTDIILGIILFGLLLGSTLDSSLTAANRRAENEKTKSTVIEQEYIKSVLDNKESVLVKIGADWCLTCRYNESFVFDVAYIEDIMQQKKVAVLDVDWTNYNEEVLAFMKKYGRYGLPFYVLFTPAFPDGIVLPEVLTTEYLEDLLDM